LYDTWPDSVIRSHAIAGLNLQIGNGDRVMEPDRRVL
jgi:hypothetical protein